MGKKKLSNNEGNNLVLPILVLENYVLTPSIPQPVKIENQQQKEIIDQCFTKRSDIFIATSESHGTNPENEKIKEIGVVCVIDRVLQMPGAPSLLFVRPSFRAKFEGMIYSPSIPIARISPLKKIEAPKRKSLEIKYTEERISALFDNVTHFLGEPEKIAAEKVLEENSNNILQKLYAISHVSPISWEEKYRILECDTFKKLINTLAIVLDEAEQRIAIQAAVHEKTHRELSQQQREAFLRLHLKQIKEELGESEDNDDISDLLSKSLTKEWDQETRKHFEKEMQKLRRLNVNNPEYSVQYSYLEAFLDLPWNNYKHSNISLDKVKEILDRDHFGLDKVKERILEYMAVVKLRNDLKAPILCLYGPPGVGKTSIGKSVAEAVGREYSRISLGGMHDEAEIRGHRRTYIGAMPGRFLHALSKLKFGNPLILLDEIDKVGKDFKGDPSSALLEALDPEQNNTFHDNFIDYPYDLSKVLFIATANDLSTIPAPLKDRMEIIEIPGYEVIEKKEIALRHLIDKALLENGFNKGELTFSPEAIDTIIRSFTHEKGVRQLNKAINRIIRKIALLKVQGKNIPEIITPDLVTIFLDKKDFQSQSVGFRL